MPEPGEPIQGLIEQLQTGSSRDEAFRRLFDLYSPRLYHFFIRRGFSHQDSLDLTQETFLGIYRGMETFRRDASFETWLFKIATNAYRKRLRRGAAGKRDAREVPLEDQDEAGPAGRGPAPGAPAPRETLRRQPPSPPPPPPPARP